MEIIDIQGPQAARLLKDLRLLPRKLRERGKVGDLFRTALATEFLRELHKAFMLKSTGATDEFGIHWDKLHPATIKAKRTRQRQRRFEKAVSRYTALGLSTEDAKEKAADFANRLSSSRVPIGIDTHRLENSLRPSLTSDDIQLHLTSQGATIHNRVPYLQHFAARRPILNDRARKVWFRRAVRFAQKLVALKLARNSL